ncbi:hypothetical protein MARTH_orf032 [Metamycoplasma arthritidis 158L3-1]|uniref:Uncharacterized protein n=1 Tax=Metamycoplasma arthritidis (strain 158L3-1) TaxID=243272 RepID=B3PLU6_META1|nr:hypothetical protein MARTH_orf032 [Metamycoplasma arthritidis 158L3-1]
MCEFLLFGSFKDENQKLKNQYCKIVIFKKPPQFANNDIINNIN